MQISPSSSALGLLNPLKSVKSRSHSDYSRRPRLPSLVASRKVSIVEVVPKARIVLVCPRLTPNLLPADVLLYVGPLDEEILLQLVQLSHPSIVVCPSGPVDPEVLRSVLKYQSLTLLGALGKSVVVVQQKITIAGGPMLGELPKDMEVDIAVIDCPIKLQNIQYAIKPGFSDYDSQLELKHSVAKCFHVRDQCRVIEFPIQL